MEMKEIQPSRGMTLSKAIERLEEHTHYAYKVGQPNLLSAIKLGIEALKRIEATRLVRKQGTVVLLPGETEE